MAPIVPPGKVVFGMQLPVQAQSTFFVEPWETKAGPAEMLEVAKAADDSGFFYIGVCDHVAIPDDLSPKMSAVWYDTIATLGWLAGQTTRTRLLSTVFNLAYRHPLVSAKSFATLDLLSAGRVIVGLGVGHVEKEFAALGLDVAKRARLTEDAYPVFEQALATGKVGAMEIEPRAAQQPRPPIWFGGAAEAAVKRAAKADGWIPQGTPQEQMPAMIKLFRDERGDDTGDIGAISEWIYLGDPSWDLGRPAATGSPEKIAESLRAWTSLGVNHLQVRFPSRSVEELVDQVTAFGATVGPLLS
jgi:alkanesulfonate monooxygenase SsuD/methylene tetrahydromethanopterin reductase-like flavin-dependent oxidoreductase (luciferase family)